MTSHQYLANLLEQQAIRPSEVDLLRGVRDEIEAKLRQAYGGAPRFYYGGSFGKDTMIRASYDLDIVIYFPSTERAPLREIFNGVHGQLTGNGYKVQTKTVALRLPYQEGFHVDVVPGRAQDNTYRYSTLYKNEGAGSTLQTSLKLHIDAVRKTGIRDVVKLMKLWRLRHDLSWSTFSLEIAVARALKGRSKDDLGVAMREVFNFLVEHFHGTRLVDPANSNNVVEMSFGSRAAVVSKAAQSLTAPYWGNVVW
jgi:hypothetical protein